MKSSKNDAAVHETWKKQDENSNWLITSTDIALGKLLIQKMFLNDHPKLIQKGISQAPLSEYRLHSSTKITS